MIEQLPRDMIKMLLLEFCQGADALRLALTCKKILERFSVDEMNHFRCLVIRERKQRFYAGKWAQNKEKWDKRLICDICNQCFTRPKRINRGSLYPKAEKISKLEKHRKQCMKHRGNANCEWCGLRDCVPCKCPLRNTTCSEQTWTHIKLVKTNYTMCSFKGIYAQVDWHQRICKIRCKICNVNVRSKDIKHHVHAYVCLSM